MQIFYVRALSALAERNRIRYNKIRTDISFYKEGIGTIKALAFGEVLWDVFPGGKRLGGAPMNFCAHFSKMGGEAYLISAVGNEESGREILKQAEALAVQKDYISIAPYPTGACHVTYDEQGKPSYALLQNRAYDCIDVSEDLIKQIHHQEFDVFYFGTLAQRGDISKKSLTRIIDRCSFKERFCDLNLRQNFYHRHVIEKCLYDATILKVNRYEWNLLIEMGFADFKPDASSAYSTLCKDICKKYNIDVIIITLDQDGAVGYSHKRDLYFTSERSMGRVVSTVGAGDSFSACFLYHYLSGTDFKDCMKYANTLSDYVVGFEEAIPEYSEEILMGIK